jgi:hypothetical protein
MARSRMRARRIESAQGERNWDDDELAQCLSRPLGGIIPSVMVCIQSGHIFYTVTVALPQTASHTAYAGSVSKVLACRTLYRGGGMKMNLQCLSRPVGSVIPFVVVCIQSGHMFCPITVALLQITTRTADAGGVSEVLAGRMLYRPL